MSTLTETKKALPELAEPVDSGDDGGVSFGAGNSRACANQRSGINWSRDEARIRASGSKSCDVGKEE
jgi:hypothetical protein